MEGRPARRRSNTDANFSSICCVIPISYSVYEHQVCTRKDLNRHPIARRAPARSHIQPNRSDTYLKFVWDRFEFNWIILCRRHGGSGVRPRLAVGQDHGGSKWWIGEGGSGLTTSLGDQSGGRTRRRGGAVRLLVKAAAWQGAAVAEAGGGSRRRQIKAWSNGCGGSLYGGRRNTREARRYGTRTLKRQVDCLPQRFEKNAKFVTVWKHDTSWMKVDRDCSTYLSPLPTSSSPLSHSTSCVRIDKISKEIRSVRVSWNAQSAHIFEAIRSNSKLSAIFPINFPSVSIIDGDI